MAHGMQGRKQLPAILPSSAPVTSQMLVSFSSCLDAQGRLNFPELWKLRKEQVLVASHFIFHLAAWCKNIDFVIPNLCSNLSLIARNVTILIYQIRRKMSLLMCLEFDEIKYQKHLAHSRLRPSVNILSRKINHTLYQ